MLIQALTNVVFYTQLSLLSSQKATSIINYFEPLTKWLDEQQAYYGYETEWELKAWEPVGFTEPPVEAELEGSDETENSSQAATAALALLATWAL